jgi:glucose-1-phosphate thymidylyltransferase
MSCPEEIAWRLGWIQTADVERLGHRMRSNQYGQYLLRIVAERAPAGGM